MAARGRTAETYASDDATPCVHARRGSSGAIDECSRLSSWRCCTRSVACPNACRERRAIGVTAKLLPCGRCTANGAGASIGDSICAGGGCEDLGRGCCRCGRGTIDVLLWGPSTSAVSGTLPAMGVCKVVVVSPSAVIILPPHFIVTPSSPFAVPARNCA